MKKIIIILLGLGALVGCSGGSSSHPQPAKAKFAYVLNKGDDTVSQYSVGSSGELIPLTTPKVPTGSFPSAIVMDESQSHLYVANMGADTISQYTIGADGGLTEIGTPIATGMMPESLVLSSDGLFIYSVNSQGESITRYFIGTNGELSLVDTQSLSVGPIGLTFSPSGNFAYAINVDTTISQFSVAANGALNPLTPATVISSGCPSGPLGTTKTTAGEFIYVLSCYTEEVEVFSMAQDGALTSLEVVKTGISPQGMTVSGTNLYVTNAGEGTISPFTIQSSGRLTAQSVVAAGDAPETLAVAGKGQSAYVLDYVTDLVQQYSVTTTGELVKSTNSPVATGVSPIRILLKY